MDMRQWASPPDLLEESVSESNLPPLGRILNTLLSAKYQELRRCCIQNDASLPKGSVHRALVAFLQHAEIALQRGDKLDELIVPLLEHVVKTKARSNRKQVMYLMQWLLQNMSIATAVPDSLQRLLQSKHFHHQGKLGWCIVVCDLVQQRNVNDETLQPGVWDEQLLTLLNCVADLLSIMLETSVNDMPTRLSISAADCIILLSKFAAGSDTILEESSKSFMSVKKHQEQLLPMPNSRSVPAPLELDSFQSDSCDRHPVASTSGRESLARKELILWEQLDNLLELTLQLKKWNEKSRPLHAKGLWQIERCLQNLAHFRDTIEAHDEGKADLSIPISVLASCWKRYSVLMLLENSPIRPDSKTMVQQWIEGLKHSLQTEELRQDDELHGSTPQKADEIRVFFLACLALLLGRLDAEELESLIDGFKSELLHALFGQLRAKHTDVVDLAAAILRMVLFHSNVVDTSSMDTVITHLMDLLDERDSVTRAVAVLIADYFAMHPGAAELERLFAMLESEVSVHRQNAISVLSELLTALSLCNDSLTHTVRKTVASHLLNRLGDVELTNRVEVSQLFGKLDPEFVLPALVQRVYFRDDKVRSAASSSILSVMKAHNNQWAVLSIFLDACSSLTQKATPPIHPGQIGCSTNGQSIRDMDRIMHLIPAWSHEVKEWDHLITMILERMFSEPSNPVMPRFLSEIRGYLSDNVSIVLKHVFAFMAKQPKMREELVESLKGQDACQDEEKSGHAVFERISPLLVLKILPLKAFDDARNQELYGTETVNGILSDNCITQFLIDRACGLLESHDVRKLSAELLGRFLPQVVVPVLRKQLEWAVENRSTMEEKACIFALCSSLWLRGKAALYDQSMVYIKSLLVWILLRPCLSTDKDTFTTQHGCIDCFAMMICAELALPSASSHSKLMEPFEAPRNSGSLLIEEIPENEYMKGCHGNQPTKEKAVLLSIISCITGQEKNIPFLPNIPWEEVEIRDTEKSADNLTIQMAFRICMANVLISATQKILRRESYTYASQIVPPLMSFIQTGRGSNMKSACLQILFTAVHNLKDAVIPYAVDLLNISLGILKSRAPAEERMAAARLMASLLSSNESITKEFSAYLSEALVTLEMVSRMDSSTDLRAFCDQLLKCMLPADSDM